MRQADDAPVPREADSVDRAVRVVLAVGLAISSLLLVAGFVVWTASGGDLPASVHGPVAAARDLVHLKPIGFFSLGLLVLILTPFARVVGTMSTAAVLAGGEPGEPRTAHAAARQTRCSRTAHRRPARVSRRRPRAIQMMRTSAWSVRAAAATEARRSASEPKRTRWPGQPQSDAPKPGGRGAAPEVDASGAAPAADASAAASAHSAPGPEASTSPARVAGRRANRWAAGQRSGYAARM